MSNLIDNYIKVYFVRDHIEGTPPPFEIFLVNNSKTNTYKNIKVISSSAWSSEDTVAKSNTLEKDLGELLPLSSISIDKSDIYELEAIVSYKVILEDKNNAIYRFKINLHGYISGKLENVLGSKFKGIDISNELIAC